jgi:aminocarboxymuconate-semialdehyde decarboxylase
MRIIDSHFHHWPRAVFERLCSRQGYPRAERNEKGGYTYWRKEGKEPAFNVGSVWFELAPMLERMDKLGHQVDVISSIGPFSPHFSDVTPEEGREDAMLWNEEIAAAQRKYPGRFWGSAAVPLTDTQVAIEVLDHAVEKLGLIGVNIPGSIGNGGRIDDARLEPFYDRVEQLGVTIFMHPTDTLFNDLLEGYDGALYLGLGRVMDVSVAASRMVYSGLMERHPNLKIYMSHTGGALPYQSGRMDKSFSKGIKLPHPTSTYIKRMYTDVVSPHAMGMKFAVEYYGADHILYGSDYPCWNPSTALALFDEIGLSKEDQQKILHDNARRFFALRDPVQAKHAQAVA